MESFNLDERGKNGKFYVSHRLQEFEDKFKKDGGEFMEYKIGELFEVKSNPQLDKENFVFSNVGKYPYFTRTIMNNGILGYVEYLDEEHKIKGNSLAVGMLGMQFFYMKSDFMLVNLQKLYIQSLIILMKKKRYILLRYLINCKNCCKVF